MRYDAPLAAIRFGMGLHPRRELPRDAQEILDRLTQPDRMARRFKLPAYAETFPLHAEYSTLQRQARQTDDKAEAERLQAHLKEMRAKDRGRYQLGARMSMARAVDADFGFRERLVRFWADHFTVRGKQPFVRDAVSSYVNEAIRPHIAGNFATLLRAAVTHVSMLVYLDQIYSAGPNSVLAGRRKNVGLNENLAREVLELHTMGVNAAYSQTDVRQLAELFAGLSFEKGKGFLYRPGLSEPGAETILGKAYDGQLESIYAVLDDLALHPATARHLARKLAVHFVSDRPDPALVDHMAAAYRTSGGELMATYAAMLEHPSAWGAQREKARQPFDFIAASLRAMAVPGKDVAALELRQTNRLLIAPMRLMGHYWERPNGPDGLPEEAEVWITPQGLAARIHWAMNAPGRLVKPLPDPRRLVQDALGGLQGEALSFAAQAAESRAEGIAIVLSAPEFNRR